MTATADSTPAPASAPAAGRRGTAPEAAANGVAYIDDRPYPLLAGETVLQFLDRHRGQGSVPTLCHDPRLEAFGSCRVCSVEVALQPGGPRRTVAACHTPMNPDWRIYPDSANILRLRQNIIELVLTDHPLDCLTCEVNGNCQLQTVAARVGVREVRYPAGKDHSDRQKDLSHPYMTSDLKKCIHCYRCVRACDEIQGQFVLSMYGRGFDNRIIKGLDSSFEDSACVSCGACAQTCPTSAISDVFRSKSLEATEKVRTVCTYCGVGCNLDVAVLGGEVHSIQAPAEAEVNHGHTCVKGRYAFGFYKHPDRLRTPLIRKNGQLEPTSWEEAYDLIATKLKAIGAEHGPDAIAGISSARCTNEENYLMQKLLRAVIGTNNIDCCARVCHAPTAYGMQQSFGTGAATNSIEELDLADCLLIIGANPTHSHPVTGARLKQRALKGVPTIVIDPRVTEMARLATHHLAVKPGGNVAVLNMMARCILDAGLVNETFVAERCAGFAEYAAELRKMDLAHMAAVCDLDLEQVRAAALTYARAPRAMAFHGLGVTEHSQGSKTVQLIANLAMMCGQIGRPGTGVNPLRGQNNVQGAADMGAQPHQGAGYLDVSVAANRAVHEEIYGRPLPKAAGLKIPQMFDAACAGRLKALYIIGEDIAQTDPNTAHVKKALEALEFVVLQELFMTETAAFADVILPAASFLEKDGTFTNGERRIQKVQHAVEPIAGAKPDGRILTDVMQRMGYPQADYDAAQVLAEIARAVPFFAGVRWAELGDNGKQWPVGPDGVGTAILHTTGFKTGKGKFAYFDWEQSAELTEHGAEFPFILTTGRVLQHYNAGTMTRRTPNARLEPADLLVINPVDAAQKGVSEGDQVRLRSERGEVQLAARVSTEVRPGILYTTFHFPEAMVNQVTSEVTDAESMCPEYKVTAVDFEKAAGA